jgi:hypothetical protein
MKKKDTETPEVPPVKDPQARKEAVRAKTALKNVREGYGHGTNEREGDKTGPGARGQRR